jgi:hypothetical protein
VKQLSKADGAQVYRLLICFLEEVRSIHETLEVVAMSLVKDVA